MNELKMITHEDIPRWYELSFKEEVPALMLRIYKEFIDKKKIDFNKAPIVEHFKKELNLKTEFKDNFESDIGFDGVFKYYQEKNGFHEYMIEIPIVKKYTGKPCKDCNGTGKNKYDENCLYCGGTGKQWDMDWREAQKISATFTILTHWLHYIDFETTSKHPQLFLVDTATRAGQHGGSLSGDISITMSDILEKLGDSAPPDREIRLTDVIEATKLVYNRMVGSGHYFDWDFNAYIGKRGFVVINCPGDACGLHTSSSHRFKGEGTEFSCHNTDSSIQQLTLLTGLAVLGDRVKKIRGE